MTARSWQEDLIENSGAATGSWVITPGGIIAFTFEGTVTDVDIEVQSGASGSAVAIPVAELTTVAAAGMISVAIPAGKVRAVVNTGANVYVRATKVI